MNDTHSPQCDGSWLIDRDLLFFPERIVEPSSWAGHVPFAAWLMGKLQPSMLVELGTHTGFSYSAFCQAVRQQQLPTRCYAVDTWQGDEHAGRYDSALFDELSQFHDARYTGFSRLLRMTFDDALSHFADGSVELLHIDGLHTFDAVKHDFDTWLPKVCPRRGVILFHDTNVRHSDFGVWRLWEALCSEYPHVGFDHSHGLGVLLVGDSLPAAVTELAVRFEREPAFVKEVFSRLGQTVEQAAALGRQQQLLDERWAMIQEREGLIAERDTWLEAHNRRREFLEGLVGERDSQLEARQQASEALKERLAQCEAGLSEARGELQRMRETASWRVTAPLRKLKNRLGG